MFNNDLNSDLLDGMQESHKSVLFNYWSLNADIFKQQKEKLWPPPIDTIISIFRRREYFRDYEKDLPAKKRWMRLEGKKYQPSPKNIKTRTAEDPLLRIEELFGFSEGNSISSSATQSSTLIRFRRIGSESKSGKRNTYIVNVFVDSSPLKPSDSLEAALKIAATKNSKIFVKKNNHDMVLELKDNEDSDTIAVDSENED